MVMATNMLFTFTIAQVFLTMLCHLKFGLFYFFVGFVVIVTIFIALLLPETKNVHTEEMNILWTSHWFNVPHDIDIHSKNNKFVL